MLRVAHARADMKINDIQPINALTSTLTRSASPAGVGPDLQPARKSPSPRSAAPWTGTTSWPGRIRPAPRQGPVYLPDTNAWYAMVGYRFGKVLPYYAHASAKGAGARDRAASLAKVPATERCRHRPAGRVRTNLDLIGVRWDFAKSGAESTSRPRQA
jgi:hypothetical protein